MKDGPAGSKYKRFIKSIRKIIMYAIQAVKASFILSLTE